MISIFEPDRDALRFLWVDDINKESAETVVLRFARVVFGVLSSPFLLNATIRHHLKKYADIHPEFVEAFLRSVYVDDVSFGSENDDDTFELFRKSKNVLAEGGFNLRKFVTNSRRLQERIDLCECSLALSKEEDTADDKEQDRPGSKEQHSASIMEEDISYCKGHPWLQTRSR